MGHKRLPDDDRSRNIIILREFMENDPILFIDLLDGLKLMHFEMQACFQQQNVTTEEHHMQELQKLQDFLHACFIAYSNIFGYAFILTASVQTDAIPRSAERLRDVTNQIQVIKSNAHNLVGDFARLLDRYLILMNQL